jgi:hypothetical protein
MRVYAQTFYKKVDVFLCIARTFPEQRVQQSQTRPSILARISDLFLRSDVHLQFFAFFR